MRSVMNDPSFAYGTVYGPNETLEKSITLLQTRLAKVDPQALTLDYLDSQYSSLFQMLVDHGLCAVTAYTRPIISKDVWLRHQLSRIERYRD
jgi:IS1 family transposase